MMAILETSIQQMYIIVLCILYYMSPKHIRKSKTIENSQDFYD